MDIAREIMDLGLGVLALSREKAGTVLNDLSKKGKLSRKQSQALIKEFVKKGQAEEKDLEKKLSKLMHGTLSKFEFATKEDIRRLERRISKQKADKGRG
jgi:polyhydroxyalkanoate synthesis regulator phasin